MKRTRHGRSAAMVRVRLAGFRSVDRRMVAARTAMAWRSELLADLGGEESLTAARMALVESATRTWLCVQSLDAWLLGQTSLVNARRKGVHPVVRERLLLVESLQRTLLALGLDRVPKPAKSLEAIAAEIATRRGQGSEGPELLGAPRSHDGEGGTHEEQAEAVESAGGVSEPGQAGREEAPAGPDPTPPVTDAVTVAADQAAGRVLGTWTVQGPEPGPEVEVAF